MHRTARPAASDEEASGRNRLLAAVAIALAVCAAGGWYLYESGRTARLAGRTIALQERLLATKADPTERRRALEEIMHSIDRLPPAEIRRVRDALFKRINAMRLESLERFAEASPDERTAMLDEDLDRIRLVRGVMDATDQGGMRPYTEAEIVEREQRRKQRDEQARQAAAAAPKPAAAPRQSPTPRPPTAEQKQASEYIDALTKRAKEKKVDLGRMFSRPPGRG
jgi:uncharacterized protein HemX